MANAPSNDAPYRLLSNVDFGEDVAVQAFTNLYGCRIGDHSRVGPFVEIQSGVEIQSHTFICTGVTIEDEVFVGHGVIFINDKRPRSTTDEGELQTDEDWELIETVIERRASLGSGAIVMGGVRVGAGAVVGAGAMVTKDVAPGEVVAGNPARALASAARHNP